MLHDLYDINIIYAFYFKSLSVPCTNVCAHPSLNIEIVYIKRKEEEI